MSIPKPTFCRKAIIDEEEHYDSLPNYDSDSDLSDVGPNEIIEEAEDASASDLSDDDKNSKSDHLNSNTVSGRDGAWCTEPPGCRENVRPNIIFQRAVLVRLPAYITPTTLSICFTK